MTMHDMLRSGDFDPENPYYREPKGTAFEYLRLGSVYRLEDRGDSKDDVRLAMLTGIRSSIDLTTCVEGLNKSNGRGLVTHFDLLFVTQFGTGRNFDMTEFDEELTSNQEHRRRHASVVFNKIRTMPEFHNRLVEPPGQVFSVNPHSSPSLFYHEIDYDPFCIVGPCTEAQSYRRGSAWDAFVKQRAEAVDNHDEFLQPWSHRIYGEPFLQPEGSYVCDLLPRLVSEAQEELLKTLLTVLDQPSQGKDYTIQGTTGTSYGPIRVACS